jgi:hypothetical protein
MELLSNAFLTGQARTYIIIQILPTINFRREDSPAARAAAIRRTNRKRGRYVLSVCQKTFIKESLRMKNWLPMRSPLLLKRGAGEI